MCHHCHYCQLPYPKSKCGKPISKINLPPGSTAFFKLLLASTSTHIDDIIRSVLEETFDLVFGTVQSVQSTEWPQRTSCKGCTFQLNPKKKEKKEARKVNKLQIEKHPEISRPSSFLASQADPNHQNPSSTLKLGVAVNEEKLRETPKK